jgi:hypothetical protein
MRVWPPAVLSGTRYAGHRVTVGLDVGSGRGVWSCINRPASVEGPAGVLDEDDTDVAARTVVGFASGTNPVHRSVKPGLDRGVLFLADVDGAVRRDGIAWCAVEFQGGEGLALGEQQHRDGLGPIR